MFFGRPPLVGSLLPFILIKEGLAQSGPGVYSLDAVPTTACDGKAGSGSATYSTQYPLDTSVKQLNIYSDGDKGYAKQKGAVWKIWSDTKGVTFSSIGVPGAGAGYSGSEDPETALKAKLKINDDKISTNFNISDSSDDFDHQILITVTPPGGTTKREDRKFRERAAAASSASSAGYTVTMTATWPCSDGPGIATSLAVSTPSSDVATACLNNQIADSTDSWKAYGVDAYLSSLIAQETNSPSHPVLPIGGIPGGPIKSTDLDIGSVLTKDADGPNICKVSEDCELTKCSLIRGDGPVDALDPARNLAFNAYANINNMLYEYWTAIKFASISENTQQDALVKTFFTTTPPAVTWQQIVGTVQPFIVILSSFAGLIPVVGAWAGIGVLAVSQIAGAASSIDTAAHPAAPSLEEKFDEAADLGTAIQSYVTNMTTIVETLHSNLIDNVYGPTFLNVTHGGALVNNFTGDTSKYSSTIIQDMSALFYMKAIDWVMKQDSTFIFWVPYGPRFTELDSSSYKTPYPVVHDFAHFAQTDCEATYQGGDNGTVFTICDAGSETKGMARIYQLTNKVKKNTYTSAVTGWDSNFEVPGGWKFNLPDVMRGAVNSWQAGGFNYNPDNLPKDNLTALVSSFDSSPTRAGIWTIPVSAFAFTYARDPPNDGQWHQSLNAMSFFPEATKSNKGFDFQNTWIDCADNYQYRNAKTGAMPDVNGTSFAHSGLTSDLLAVMDLRDGQR